MQAKPDVSITIVSFNTRDLTRQCLQSIRDNTRKVSYEVCVVDNNSSDGSAEMMSREFPEIHLIRNRENKGLAAATNQGLEASTGRYVMALNSDTVMHANALDNLVSFMDEHPEVGGATPRLVLPDGGAHPTFVGEVPSLKAELMGALLPLNPRMSGAVEIARFGRGIDYAVTQEVPCVLWGTAFIVRREALERIGGQDPRFFVYAEDVDWSMRMSRAGWKLCYVAEAEVTHYGGQSTKQSGVKMSAQLVRSKCRMIQKHYGFLAGLVLRTAYVAQLSARAFKWMVLYAVRPGMRVEAISRMRQMWSAIRAAMA